MQTAERCDIFTVCEPVETDYDNYDVCCGCTLAGVMMKLSSLAFLICGGDDLLYHKLSCMFAKQIECC